MPDPIEMTTFSTTKLNKHPNGSFDGTASTPAGSYLDFMFDSVTGTFDVKTIMSEAPGEGRSLMQGADRMAGDAGATTMVTATSRPGFFLKSGFDYTDAQKAINARKYTAEELRAQENNHEASGGGFSMVKYPPFT